MFRILLLLLPLPTWAGLIEGHLVRYTAEQGLSQATALAFGVGPAGFMWVGTQDGLNRFDGYRFKAYNHDKADQHSIGNSYVKDLHLDRKNRFWVAHLSGMDRYHPEKDQFERIPLPDDFQYVRHISEAPDGSLILATSRGLARFFPDNGELIYPLVPDETELVYTIAWQSDTLFWFCTNDRVATYDLVGGILEEQPIGGEHYSGLIIDSQRTVWIGSKRTGLYSLDLDSGARNHYTYATGLPDPAIENVLEDQMGRLWVGTRGGVCVFNRERNKWDLLRDNNATGESVKSNIQDIFQDDHGQIWLGLHGEGIMVFDSSGGQLGAHRYYRDDPTSMPDSQVRFFSEDSQKRLWIATFSGVARLDDETGDFVHLPDHLAEPLKNARIITLLWDREDHLWVGTYLHGLMRLDKGADQWRYFFEETDNPKHLDKFSVDYLFQRKNGQIWVGTRDGGAFRYEPESEGFTAYHADKNDPKALAAKYAIAIYEDRDQQLWITTFGGGLHRYDDRLDRFYRYTPDSHGLTSLNVLSMAQDNRGRFWVGSADGLNLYMGEDQPFKTFTTKQGLPNNLVYGLLADNQGFLWLSTNLGLARYDADADRWHTFRLADGAQDDEFNSAAYFKRSNGQLAFGGINGMNLFDPSRLEVDEQPPVVSITGLNLFNRPVAVGEDGPLKVAPYVMEKLELGPEHAVFSLEFAAAAARAPLRTRYAYKMEGFDKDWLYTDADRRFATYTNLPPGSYRFLVKAASRQGTWREDATSLPVHMAPPLWLSPLAWVFYVLLAGGLVLGYLVYQRHLRHVLEKRVAARTSELVATQRELLETAHTAGMAELAVDVLHNLGNHLNSLKTSTQLIVELVKKDQVGEALNRLETGVKEGKCKAGPDEIRAFLVKLGACYEHQKSALARESLALDQHIQTTTRLLWEQDQFTKSAEARCRPLDLAPLLRQIHRSERYLMGEKGIAFNLESPQELSVLADCNRLKRGLRYLLENARDACTKGDEVKIRLQEAEGRAEIAIIDDGEGVFSGNLDQVFRHGFSTRPGRAGRGLHYCANAVREMNGTLTIHSDGPARGTTLRLSLPLSA